MSSRREACHASWLRRRRCIKTGSAAWPNRPRCLCNPAREIRRLIRGYPGTPHSQLLGRSADRELLDHTDLLGYVGHTRLHTNYYALLPDHYSQVPSGKQQRPSSLPERAADLQSLQVGCGAKSRRTLWKQLSTAGTRDHGLRGLFPRKFKPTVGMLTPPWTPMTR